MARILELENYANSLTVHGVRKEMREQVYGAGEALKLARDAATKRISITGSAIECAWNNIYTAEQLLLKAAPNDDLSGWGSYVLALARDHLKPTDVRRTDMERLIYPPSPPAKLDHDGVGIALTALAAAHQASTSEKRRARSFRNVVFSAAGLLFVIAVGLAIFGLADRNAVNLCSSSLDPPGRISHVDGWALAVDHRAVERSHKRSVPTCNGTCSSPTPDPSPPPVQVNIQNQTNILNQTNTNQTVNPPRVDPSSRVCPAGGNQPNRSDAFLVEVIGAAAAALTAAVALRSIWGTSTPYSIPFALTLLKIPAGAVSAFVGLLMVNAALIPGLTKLATQGEILAWAAIFGVAQQALTHFVDAKGQRVLNAVQGPEVNPAQPSDATSL